MDVGVFTHTDKTGVGDGDGAGCNVIKLELSHTVRPGTLIELVESKPCLWDKTADCFKDKIEKQKAWKEVYTFLEDFSQKEKKEQQKIVSNSSETITGKWQNIHDSFVKSLKKKSGQAAKKKYLYHDNLTFLLKVVQSDDTESSIDDSQHEQHSQINAPQDDKVEVEIEVQAQRNVAAKPKERSETTKKPRLQEEVDQRILRALEHPPDEDEAFFISITPSVRKMSEEDKLEFRMNVLQLIRDINRRQNNFPLQPPLSAYPSRSVSRSSTSRDRFPTASEGLNNAYLSEENPHGCSSWNPEFMYDNSNPIPPKSPTPSSFQNLNCVYTYANTYINISHLYSYIRVTYIHI
ncbi:BESS motif [Popillia japonica]|uniref:BESS motif n=1 Tax=Popillia japonica TaxID=7064 RepID=A0AAW1IFU2_POPJA